MAEVELGGGAISVRKQLPASDLTRLGLLFFYASNYQVSHEVGGYDAVESESWLLRDAVLT